MQMKTMSFVDQIRAAVNADSRSRYRICLDAGIGQPSMSRFMRRREFFSSEKLDRLAAVLDLQIVITPDREGK